MHKQILVNYKFNVYNTQINKVKYLLVSILINSFSLNLYTSVNCTYLKELKFCCLFDCLSVYAGYTLKWLYKF